WRWSQLEAGYMSAPDTAQNSSEDPLAQGAVIHVVLIGYRPICPFPAQSSAHGNDLGGAEGVVSVHDGGLAAVAQANKTARIAWAGGMTRGTVYTVPEAA
ncbi:hypothetical protein V8J36_22305, partial [Frigidibacter sp. MR17.14]|uniref:hypothetical protein n=1 Tax=Frigidibacter sp. MR17.14 TaxID=3126509 RepID=UPI0030130B29